MQSLVTDLFIGNKWFKEAFNILYRLSSKCEQSSDFGEGVGWSFQTGRSGFWLGNQDTENCFWSCIILGGGAQGWGSVLRNHSEFTKSVQNILDIPFDMHEPQS